MKVYLVVAVTEIGKLISFDAVRDLEDYITNLYYIGADLRLSMDQELLILEMITEDASETGILVLKSPCALNRFNYLTKLRAQNAMNIRQPFVVQVVVPNSATVYSFDSYPDKGILNLDDNRVKNLSVFKYSNQRRKAMEEPEFLL